MPKHAQKQLCANIKNKKHSALQCTHPAKHGDFCKLHYKNPHRFVSTVKPAAHDTYAIILQRWWRFQRRQSLMKLHSFAVFCRNVCHNHTEIASLESLDSIPTMYFIGMKQNKKIWGFDIRTLLKQYEKTSVFINPYTTEKFDFQNLELFRKLLEKLRSQKISLEFQTDSPINPKQSWNFRVLDICLRLEVLGYRIATQWISELTTSSHRTLYTLLHNTWFKADTFTEELRETIVPNYNDSSNKLFQFNELSVKKCDLDCIRRTNIHIIHRLISSAKEQSDRTLAAMNIVSALSCVSEECYSEYHWLLN